MLPVNNKTITLCLTLIAAICIIIPGNSIATESTYDTVTESTAIIVTEGKVKRFNQQTQTLLLQLKNGEKITVLLDWNTSLLGYDSPKEIKKGNKVKIWHSANDQQTPAVKIEKKLMLGC